MYVCVCVCVHGAADWEDVEGADAVLKGPWPAYKTPACYDRSPVISERYSSQCETSQEVAFAFFTDRFFFIFYKEMKDWPVASNSRPWLYLQI